MNVVRMKLNENFVEGNAAHQHTVDVPEFEPKMSTAKAKKKMAIRRHQFDNDFHLEISRMMLATWTAEQILKSMKKAPLEHVLQRARDAFEKMIYAMAPAESEHQLQEGTGSR